jgi:hypothetical protein
MHPDTRGYVLEFLDHVVHFFPKEKMGGCFKYSISPFSFANYRLTLFFTGPQVGYQYTLVKTPDAIFSCVFDGIVTPVSWNKEYP